MQTLGDYSNTFPGEKEYSQQLAQEFKKRVDFDFSRILFLGVVPGKEAYLMEIIEQASRRRGYEKHRTIKYRSRGCEKTCHLYVRYGSTSDALDARKEFRKWDDLNAELVSDILKSWYICEKLCSPYGGVTQGTLDLVGGIPSNQVLNKDIADCLLKKFGNPTINIDKGAVHVAFSSMAEGIAACIVYGNWRERPDDKDDVFYYRVQLDGTDSFSALIREMTHSKASETYKLEYFAHPDDVPHGTSSNYQNPNRGRNFSRGRQFSRSRSGQNHRNSSRHDRKYQSGSFYQTYNTSDQFSQDGTYYQQADFSYIGQS